jgi:hypothetical protein
LFGRGHNKWRSILDSNLIINEIKTNCLLSADNQIIITSSGYCLQKPAHKLGKATKDSNFRVCTRKRIMPFIGVHNYKYNIIIACEATEQISSVNCLECNISLMYIEN